MANQFLGTANDSSLFGAQPPSYYLNYNNLSNKPSLAFLPLTGGIVTGSLGLRSGSYVQTFSGGSGSDGYIRIATISIISHYQNAPIYFKIQQRGKIGSDIYIAFKNVPNTSPEIDYFIKTSSSLDAYVHSPSSTLYHLYIGKSEGYDNIAVTAYHLPPYMSGTNLTWDGTFVASVPTGGTSAVFRNTADSLLNARTISLTGNVTGSTSFDGSKNVAIATQLAWSITLGTGDNAEINQNGSVYRQKFQMFDNATPNDAVFVFSQSENSGASYKTLMQINDDGNVIANRFTGNATSAIKLATARSIFGKSFDGTNNVAGQGSFYGTYTSIPGNRYASSAIEIRECNLVMNTQDDIGYAPRIGFHWGGKSAATLTYAVNNEFQFRNQADTGYVNVRAANFLGALTGTATNATQLGGVAASGWQKKFDGTINDFNSTAAITQGEYQVVPPASNGPGAQYGKLVSIVDTGGTHNNSSNWIWQIYYETSNTVWFRNKTNASAWTAWRMITFSNGTYSGMTVGKSTNSDQLGGTAAANYINTSDTLILRGMV